MSIDFRAFKILPSNVKLACDRVKHRFELEASLLNVKIKIPKIEAFAVVDDDFERIRIQRHEYIVKGPMVKRAQTMRRLEYGANYSVKDTVKMINAFTTTVWNKTTDKIAYAEIFIRASIYKSNREKFYEILEHEVTHVLFPKTIIAYSGKYTRSGLAERAD